MAGQFDPSRLSDESPAPTYEEYVRAREQSPGTAPQFSLGVVKTGPPEPTEPTGPVFDPAKLDAIMSQPTPEPSFIGETGAVLSGVNRGIREGVAGTAGLPVDVVNALFRGRFGEAPPGGSESIRRGLESVMPADIPAQTLPGQIAKAGAEGAASFATGAGIAGAAGRLNAATSIFGDSPWLTRLAELDTAGLMKAQALLGSVFGAGGEVASKTIPKDSKYQPLVRLVGGLISQFGFQGARGAIRWMLQDAAKGAKEFVSTKLATLIPRGSQAERNLTELGPQIQAEFPEVRPTTGQVTGSGALQSLAAQRAAQSGTLTTQLEEQPGRATAALQSRLRSIEPTGQPAVAKQRVEAAATAEDAATRAAAEARDAAAVRAIQEEQARMHLGLESEITQAKNELSQTVRRLQPAGDRRQVGEQLREEVDRLASAAADKAKGLWAEVPQDVELRIGAVVDGKPGLARRVDGIIGQIRTRPGATVPKTLTDLSEQIAQRGETATFGDVQEWRSAVNDAVRQAPAGSPERRWLAQTQAALDDAMVQEGPANAAYRAAADAWRDYKTRFMRGLVGRFTAPEKGSVAGPSGVRPRQMAEEQTADEFVRAKGDDVRRARQVKAAIGDDATANVRVRDAVVRKFLDEVDPLAYGPGTADRATKWLKDHAAIFESFPAIRDDVNQVVRAATKVKDQQAYADYLRSQVREGRVEPQRASDLLARTRDEARDAVIKGYINRSADSAMGGVLKADDPGLAMRQLLELTKGDPAARAGFRKAFTDHMEREITGGVNATSKERVYKSPDAWRTFMETPKNAEVAKALYSERELADLDRWGRMATTILHPNRAATDAELLRDLSPQQLYSMASLLGRAYGIGGGRLSLRFAVSEAVAKAIHRATSEANLAAVRKTLDEALFDPKAAAALREFGFKVLEDRAGAIRAIESYAYGVMPAAGRASATARAAEPARR